MRFRWPGYGLPSKIPTQAGFEILRGHAGRKSRCGGGIRTLSRVRRDLPGRRDVKLKPAAAKNEEVIGKKV